MKVKSLTSQMKGIDHYFCGTDYYAVQGTSKFCKYVDLILPFKVKYFMPFLIALSGIIMTPTRELALQIYRECKKFCKPLDLRVVCVYGGTGISEQVGHKFSET